MASLVFSAFFSASSAVRNEWIAVLPRWDDRLPKNKG